MLSNERLNAKARFRIGRAAVVELEFVAVEARGIMTGGKHHPRPPLPRLDRPRHRRCGCGRVGENHFEAVTRQHLGDGHCKFVR